MNGGVGNNLSTTNIDQQPTFIPLSQDRLWYPLGNSTRTKTTSHLKPFTTSINPDTTAIGHIEQYLQEHLIPTYPQLSIVINELQFMFGPMKTFWPQFILLRSLTPEARATLITQFQTDIMTEVKRLFPHVDEGMWSSSWVEVEDSPNPPTLHDIVIPLVSSSEAKLFFLVCPKYGVAFVK